MRSLLAACLLIFAASALADDAPRGRLPKTAEPLHYALQFRIDPAADGFAGVTTIRVRLNEAADHLWLHGDSLSVEKVDVTDAAGTAHTGKYAQAKDADGVARIDFGKTLPAQTIDLRIVYRSRYDEHLEGLYKARHADKPYVVTQMEPISARRAFPGFDEPVFKTPYDVTLEVPPGQKGVTNAAQKSAVKLADGWTRLTFETTAKLPTYLIAIGVGPWDVVDAPPIAASRWRDKPVPLRAIAAAGEGPRLKEILGATPQIVAALEDYFGYPYAFGKLDLLAAPDFSAGAMENAGLIIYRDTLMLLDANSPTQLRRSSFEVNTHELAHQWFGDTVTMQWWDDIWLNEAFATWLENRITGRLRPENRADLGMVEGAQYAMRADSLASARRVRQPISGVGDIEDAFDSLTYQKGAAVLGMFEAWLGEETFRSGIRNYVREHEFGNATSDDLIAALAKAGDRDERFGKAMKSFLDQPGVPQVTTSLSCDGGKAALALSQQRYFPAGSKGDAAQRWGVPVCVRLGYGDKTSVQCELLDQASGTMTLADGCPDWYLPNADSRGYYRIAMPAAELGKLTAAVDKLAEREQLGFADAIRAGFERGDVDVAAALAAMRQLAPSKTREISTSLFGTFNWIRDYLSDTTTRPALDAFATSLYLPRLRELGYAQRAGENSDDALMRSALAEFLARDVENAQVRAALVEQGRAVLKIGDNGHLTFSAANYDLLGTTLSITVQELGAPAIDALVAEIGRQSDPTLRASMIGALGATRDGKLGDRVRNYVLTDAVKLGEVSRLLGVNQSHPENHAAYWTWLKANFDALVKRMPAKGEGRLVERASDGWCAAAQEKELVEFFAPRAASLTGGDTALARAREKIALCVARREKQGTTGLAAWAKANPPAL